VPDPRRVHLARDAVAGLHAPETGDRRDRRGRLGGRPYPVTPECRDADGEIHSVPFPSSAVTGSGHQDDAVMEAIGAQAGSAPALGRGPGGLERPAG